MMVRTDRIGLRNTQQVPQIYGSSGICERSRQKREDMRSYPGFTISKLDWRGPHVNKHTVEYGERKLTVEAARFDTLGGAKLTVPAE
jgi:hypothetical protein